MTPIRVLHVVTYMGRGGLETMLMNYYRFIDRDKIQFDFLTHRDFRADYDDEIISLGGNIYHLPRLIPWSRSYKKALKAFFISHPEYRMIHVHQDCLSGVICEIAEECGISVRIAHSHCTDQDKNLKYPIKLWYRRKIPKYATDLLACGQDAGQWMFRGAPFCIMNNAIDTESYVCHPQKRAKIREQLDLSNQLVIGHIGRFFPQKNHPFLLQVFTELLKTEPNAVLLLVGGGKDMPKIKALAATLGIMNNVRFLGVRSDVADLLQAMDVFVFPSRYEGLGIVVIEAQASGLPCIVSESVPTECDITPNIDHVSLKSPVSVWVQKIMNQKTALRTNMTDQIKDAGYDIKANAFWLEKYYMERWKA